MAYVNVAEWSPEQVSEWMRGLEDCLSVYLEEIVVSKVTGRRLLELTPDLLPPLGIHKIGHQELLLQAVQHLRNIHYRLDQDTLQHLALRLYGKARSVYNELRASCQSRSSNGGGSAGEDDTNSADDEDCNSQDRDLCNGKSKPRLVSTCIVAAVADCLAILKTIVSWLTRSPFEGLPVYEKRKDELLELGIKLAMIGQRDLFAENQGAVIRDNCRELAEIADDIVQNSRDPLIIQPASLDVATIKKKPDDDLGLHLMSTYDGVHLVSIIRPLTPAHSCTKLGEGDELIQVNYQTVIGWHPDKIMASMYENPIEVILTVKKQPREGPCATQIYFKPFRLPSKKRSYNHGYATPSDYTYRNNFSNNLTLYSLMDSSSSSAYGKVFMTIPKPFPPPFASSNITEQKSRNAAGNSSAAGATLRPDTPADKLAIKRMGSPCHSIEGRQSSVSFAVCDEDHNNSGGGAASKSDTTAVTDTPETTTSDTLDTSQHQYQPNSLVITAAGSLHATPSSSVNTSLHNTSDVLVASDGDDDAFLSSDDDNDDENDDAASTSASVRLYPPKPRAPVHRRATIPGDTAPPLANAATLNQYIEGLRQSGLALRSSGRSGAGTFDPAECLIRSNAASLDGRARPHTTIGTAKLMPTANNITSSLDASNTDTGRSVAYNAMKQRFEGPVSLPSSIEPNSSTDGSNTSAPKTPTATVMGAPCYQTSTPVQQHYTHFPLPLTITSPPTPLTPNPPSTPHTPSSSTNGGGGLCTGRRVSEDRPKLDKSHSTPAYDFGADGVPVAAATSKFFTTTAVATDKSNASTDSHLSITDSSKEVSEHQKKLGDGARNISHLSSTSFTKPDCSSFNDVNKSVNADAGAASMQQRSHVPVYSASPSVSEVAMYTDGSSRAQNPREKLSESTEANSRRIEEATQMRDEHGMSSRGNSSSVRSREPSRQQTARRCSSVSPSLWRRGVMLTFRPATQHHRHGSTSAALSAAAAAAAHRRRRHTPPLPPSNTTSDARLTASTSTLATGVAAATTPAAACGVCGGGRGISCRELGAGDHQGWLYRRSRGTRTFLQQHNWEKRWFILKKGYLYGYSGQDALKAESLIYLPGFHVCPAQDAKTKKFAFKIYHANGTTFYFACDSGEERSRWMSEMGLSALSSGRCADNSGSSAASSPTAAAAHPPLAVAAPASAHSHDEEAYYSETDDELDECRSTAVSAGNLKSEASAKESSSTSNNNTTSSSGGGPLSSLFHWGSTSKTSAAPASAAVTTVSTSSSSTSSRATAALSSLVASGKSSVGGIKFLQPKQVQAVPAANFRSYRRVREAGRSTSTSDLRQATGADVLAPLTPTQRVTPPQASKSSAPVTRKGSLREKLRNHLPAALTLDRRKKNIANSVQQSAGTNAAKNKQQQKASTSSDDSSVDQQQEELNASCHDFTSKTAAVASAACPQIIEEKDSLSSLNCSMEMDESQQKMGQHSIIAENDSEDKKNAIAAVNDQSDPLVNDNNDTLNTEINKKESFKESCQPITPLKCKLINNAHRGSLDCLSTPPSSYGQYKGDTTQKSWMSVLRSPCESSMTASPTPITIGTVTKHRPAPVPRSVSHHISASNPNTPKTPGTDSYSYNFSTPQSGVSLTGFSLSHGGPDLRNSSMERLKKAGNYRPVVLKSNEPLKTAFVMGLDQTTPEINRTSLDSSYSTLQSTPNSGQILNFSPSSVVRPQVPPRTKFLSPSERTLERDSKSATSTPSIAATGDSNSTSGTASSNSTTAREAAAALLLSPISSVARSDPTFSSGAKGNQLTRLNISQTQQEDQEQPRTPMKPTMGVSMIGKQRRTPGVLSPREVFFCSPPPSPSPLTPVQNPFQQHNNNTHQQQHHHYLPHTTLASTTYDPQSLSFNLPYNAASVSINAQSRQPDTSNNSNKSLHRSHSGSRRASHTSPNTSATTSNFCNISDIDTSGCWTNTSSQPTAVTTYTGPDGKQLQVLPHYPDMEYPPIFEAGSYSITSSASIEESFDTLNSNSFVSQTYASVQQAPYTPQHAPRTPSHNQYYNLQGFNSASLPSLPVQEEPLPRDQRGANEQQHNSTSYSSGLSLSIPSQPCHSGSSPQVSPRRTSSPRSSGVIVGISCTGSSSVVSHHHNIYVTSPVKPTPMSKRPKQELPPHANISSINGRKQYPLPILNPGSNGPGVIQSGSSSTSSSIIKSMPPSSSPDGSNNAINVSSSCTTSPCQRDYLPKPVRRRTPPAHFPPSQSNSSLESISEHGTAKQIGVSYSSHDLSSNINSNLQGSMERSSSHNSGGSTTILNPLELRGQSPALCHMSGLRNSNTKVSTSGGMVASFQHGGSSGGTVLSPQSLTSAQYMIPPRLILPGPPAEPPPDD